MKKGTHSFHTISKLNDFTTNICQPETDMEESQMFINIYKYFIIASGPKKNNKSPNWGIYIYYSTNNTNIYIYLYAQ